SAAQIDADLALQLNDQPIRNDADERADRVRSAALRFVDMHGWEASVTHDYDRLRLTGGSVSIELGLGTALHDYIVGA
ncbi:MAG TPA: hypothetical protein VL977_00520, partial [Solirubrobacteraceae bacterium]|nr:hypothetical protein [Solirubrobacteraceae bacterium]